MITILYIILILSSIITTFINLSKGALFSSETIKGLVTLMHWGILIILIILATIYYSWIHIILMIIIDLVISWIFSYVIIKYLYNGKI